MVNVQAKNAKLVDRARRIIVEATGVPTEGALDLLALAESDVRLAILIAKTDVSPEEARRRLMAAEGNLAKALHG
jgi:N-acetylmuramic acid 6-phosphate etherase